MADNSLLTKSNLLSVIIVLFTGNLFFSSCSAESKEDTEKTYTEQKESLGTKEKKHPVKFIEVIGDNKKNLIGQTVIRGKIKNKASIATYKDVRIKMLCYKDGVMVEEHEDIINEVIKPNSTIDFKTKYRLPKGTDSIALSVMSVAVEETK